MNCNHCNSKMKDGTMLCHTNDYRINDSSGNLKYCNCEENPNIISYVEIDNG